MSWDKSVVRLGLGQGGAVVNRRHFLKAVTLGAAGAASVSFTDLLSLQAADLRKRNMACILLWMGGGPSQLETWDPKPDHEHGGGTKSIETAVPGIRIAKGWEKTAQVMGDLALIRSMSSKEGNHDRATYQLHTGYVPSGSVRHPGLGSLTAAELGDPKFDLPHVVSIGGPTTGAGLLGAQYEPFVIRDPEKPPQNTTLPVEVRRFDRRIGLLGSLEQVAFGAKGGGDRVNDHAALYKQTRNMVLSPHMKAFDLATEDPKTRAAYGDTPFGNGCLLARRLVEVGVTFVEVRSGGWDTHTLLDLSAKAAPVDAGASALIADLKSRGRLDTTLVVWMGEFGRTPKISARGGRDHFPRAFSMALAGGGVKGGQVIGATTPDGSAVADHPVAVNDLLTSVFHSLKVDPTKENMSPAGRPIKIVDGGKLIAPLFG
ncbi:DUF1501 domain-containing protein [Isosphaeraceae bacterium EP7]